jgi:uncharacterized protein (TIGR03437 family)
MAIDASGGKAYLLTVSGLSVIPVSIPAAASGPGQAPGGGVAAGATRMQITNNGVVNLASSSTALAPNVIVAINGSVLATDATTSATTLPTILGGSCVTLDNTPLPLLATSSGSIHAQIPPSTTAAKHTLAVRSIDNHASVSTSITVAKYAPAVFVNPDTGLAAVYHADGSPVSTSNPASRDEPLTMYASGLGATTGGTVTAGSPSPSNPLAVTGTVQVYFGPPTYKQSAIIVDWSGLAPGMYGVYLVKLRVPGDHMKGSALPVTIKVGGVSNATPAAIAVE